MPTCDDCGARVCLMSPRDLLAVVPSEIRFEVRQTIKTFGPRAFAKVCHNCVSFSLCEVLDD